MAQWIGLPHRPAHWRLQDALDTACGLRLNDPAPQARPPTNLRARPLSVDMLRPGRSSRGKGRGIRTLVRWFIVIVAAVISHGEPGADFAGFGGADGGVPGEGLLSVVPGLN
jgi:hypothetical protein